MSKEKNVIEFYVLCNKIKNVIRSGWKDWNVKRERVESIAEHIYGVQMLAIGIYSEYDYDIDIFKVIYMIAIHELGEILIGDLTPFEITKAEKIKIEHDAVHKILGNLLKSKDIEELFLEFDAKETKESRFANQCDRLECDLQCKLYDEEHCVDLNDQENNVSIKNEEVRDLVKNNSWSEAWLKFWQKHYNYDENFMAISNYALNNNITDIEERRTQI